MFAMKVTLGAYRAGLELKEKIKQKLTAQGLAVDGRHQRRVEKIAAIERVDEARSSHA